MLDFGGESVVPDGNGFFYDVDNSWEGGGLVGESVGEVEAGEDIVKRHFVLGGLEKFVVHRPIANYDHVDAENFDAENLAVFFIAVGNESDNVLGEGDAVSDKWEGAGDDGNGFEVGGNGGVGGGPDFLPDEGDR